MTMGEMVEKIYDATSANSKGNLDWSEINTTKTVTPGYYEGGTLDSRPSYNKGYSDGASGRKKITYIGGAGNINVSTFTNNWANLTADNFLVVLASLSYYLYNGNSKGQFSKSYNASTATLSVSVPNVTSSNSYVYTTVQVYLIE